MSTKIPGVENPQWAKMAYCADDYSEISPPDTDETTAQRNRRETTAVGKYCCRCTVWADCLSEALQIGDTKGVRGRTVGVDRENYLAGNMSLQELRLSGLRRVYGDQVVNEALATIPTQPAPPAIEMSAAQNTQPGPVETAA